MTGRRPRAEPPRHDPEKEPTHDAVHDPGSVAAAARVPANDAARPIHIGQTEVRVGTAGWSDRLLSAAGVFYPAAVRTPETRLRHYASRFPLVEADMGFYAIPDPATTAQWVARTPDDFVFDVKAYALMTGHAAEVARLPRVIRDALPASLAAAPRVYARDLPLELRMEVWRLFRAAIEPLHAAGKLGAVLLQFAPWIVPDEHTPALLALARERLGDLPIAIEFRDARWFASGIRERVWELLRANRMTYVMADTPPGTARSVPIVPAVTTPELAIVRLHGRRSALWGARGATVAEKYRYLYDAAELVEWRTRIDALAGMAAVLHVVFNNSYANYAVVNALELAHLLAEDAGD